MSGLFYEVAGVVNEGLGSKGLDDDIFIFADFSGWSWRA